MDLCPKVIGIDHPIIGSTEFCLRVVDRIASSLDLCLKAIRVDHLVIGSCVLQVMLLMMMMLLIERSSVVADDDDRTIE